MSIDFMDEGAKEQEKKPVISNLFPIHGKSVSAAFEKLSLTENPSGAQAAANEEMDRLCETNPYVATYFGQMLSEFPVTARETADQIYLGILIAHKILREGARLRGGILPTFTLDFVQDYHNKEVESIIAESRDKNLAIPQIGIQLRNKRLVEFENRESEFSRIVRIKLGVQSDWHPEEDPRYLGIVNLCVLFREGCKDPKNFQQ